MSMTVEVGLLSGKTATVRAGLDEQVATLKARAQSTLSVGEGQLLDSSGRRLHAHALIKDANLKNGDSLTFYINKTQVQSSIGSFAAILCDGSVVTWGQGDLGGDSSAVQDQLRHVQQIQSSSCTFAAIRDDGSVVTWGRFCCHQG